MKRISAHYSRTLLSLVTGILFLTLALLIPSSTHAAVGINETINFQGKVTKVDNTNDTNGTYSFTFKIYDQDAPGGTQAWTETKSIAVTDGVFQTALGDTTPFGTSVD